ncbi:MAG TPA: hypothetical protein VMT17_18285 [Anaeromyxobacteraceae bacterium]|nr:hypothetical protein [Anaeromyxobacteraceae bacterium]
MAKVKEFCDSLNKGDAKAALATCASPAFIIDDFPPHVWAGPTACAEWLGAYDADMKKGGITDAVVKLGKPRHVDVTGDRAYVVVPANYDYKEKGKGVAEHGSTLTVALQRGSTGWLITAWAWSKH